MPDQPAEPPTAPPEHQVPPGVEVEATWTGPDGTPHPYVAKAGWLLLREKEKPVAEIFSVSYLVASAEPRPVTFVCNGGPGAASAYLHVGALGPRRVAFTPTGTPPSPPARLVDNLESWLAFTDLVFVDPVGTGFSRTVEPPPDPPKPGGEPPDPKAFFGVQRDLDALGEFISRWLSQARRWDSPVFLAGESYGGFRVARMARTLQETWGVALNGAVLISPALEISLLDASDYDLLPWVDRFPTMAAAAAHHGRCRAVPAGSPLEEVLEQAEAFATSDYVTFLARGAAMPAAERAAVLRRAADFLGLPEELVVRAEGRIAIEVFARELLRDERRVVGLYDATVTADDPFPDRQAYAGPDPTFTGVEALFTAAVNQRIRQELGLDTDRQYHLLSFEVNRAWKVDIERHALQTQLGATDDLRYGMSLNPYLRVFITHGHHDLVTPYYASNRLRNLMRLEPEVAGRLTVRHFSGGHMFYAWEESRRAFRAAIGDFYAAALGG